MKTTEQWLEEKYSAYNKKPEKVLENMLFRTVVMERLTMWKGQIIIALIGGGAQWVLFGINILINGNFNLLVFSLAVLWSTWATICWMKFISIKTRNKLN